MTTVDKLKTLYNNKNELECIETAIKLGLLSKEVYDDFLKYLSNENFGYKEDKYKFLNWLKENNFNILDLENNENYYDGKIHTIRFIGRFCAYRYGFKIYEEVD